MIAPWNLRNFLIRHPPPATIRLTTTEGEQENIKPGKRSRVKIAETIVALAPDLVECLDNEGCVLRAMRLDSGDPVRSGVAPSLPAEIGGDPQAAMLSHFANLVHRAYEHATDIAFGKLIELVERMDARTDSIEQRLERTEAQWRREARERIDDLYDVAADAAERAAAGEPKDQILNSLLQGAMAGQQAKVAAAAKAKANGNGKGS